MFGARAAFALVIGFVLGIADASRADVGVVVLEPNGALGFFTRVGHAGTLAGWIWGRSGQSDLARALESSELRGDLLGARAAVLDARVAIYSVNFGEASGHLEDARELLGRANERLTRLGRDDDVKRVQTALASIDEAQRLAGKLDQDANSRAGEAAKLLAEVLEVAAKP